MVIIVKTINNFCKRILKVFSAVLLVGGVSPLGGCDQKVAENKNGDLSMQQSNVNQCYFDQTKLITINNIPNYLISGKAIAQNSCDKNNYHQFEERFYNDGRWVYLEFGATIVRRTGKWRIDRNSITIESTELGIFSRYLYTNNSKTLFIQSIIHTRLNEDVKIVPIHIDKIGHLYGGE